MNNKLINLINVSLLVILLITAGGCGYKSTATRTNPVAESSKIRDFKSTNGKLQLTALDDWKDSSELKKNNALISLALQNNSNDTEEYVAILSESTADVAKDYSLNDYFNTVSKDLKSTLQSATITNINDTTINGYKSKTFQVSGEIEKIKVTYAYSLIMTPNTLNQVFAFTPASQFEKSKAELIKIAGSFKELSK